MQKMTELKALTPISMARKLEEVIDEVGDKRERSLDGWESNPNVRQLRAQVRLDLKIVQANSSHFQQAFVTDYCWIQS